jgi:hypothetical protein
MHENPVDIDFVVVFFYCISAVREEEKECNPFKQTTGSFIFRFPESVSGFSINTMSLL